jgi:hypothetical protein
MINLKHLKIYVDFKGDIDMWTRLGAKKRNLIMNDEIWIQIRNLNQNLILIHNGLASESFKETIMKNLKDNCENNEVIEKLIELSAKRLLD